jgi:predicted esterase
MNRTTPHLALASVIAAMAGCSEPATTTTVTAVFEIPRDGVAPTDFYALPFPSDIRRDDLGHPIMTDYPRPVGIVARYADALPKLDGFGLNAPIFQRFSGAIDGASLPVDAEASLAASASVYLVDIDAASPDRGTRHPIKFRFQDRKGFTIASNWLGALPYPGFPLHESTTYALVVTNRLRAADGTAIERDADFAAIGDSKAVTGEVARGRARYAPLWAWLDEAGGDERADVVSAAVFTTQSVTDIMGKLRDKVRTLAPVVARDVVRRDILKVPFSWYDGAFDGPNFQTGEVPYRLEGGDIALADDGTPIIQRTEALRFSFTIPEGVMPTAGWPVVIYAHGTGGSYHSFVNDGTAGRMALEGLATISIDQVLHGPRNPGGDPDIDFFNFQNPDAGRNNAIQGAVDDFSVVRLIEGFRFDEVTPDPRTIKFDPAKISFFGHSQGGLTGPPFVAYEPKVRAAVLSGAGGLLYFALLNKTEPFDVTALLGAIIMDEPLDEWNPVLGLLQTWVERSDTINYGPLLVRQPPTGSDGLPLPPMDIYQSMGFVDHYTPLPDIEALAVSIGGDQVAPTIAPMPGLVLRHRTVATAPVTGNLNGHTAVVVQYQATISDGHFVVFDTAPGRRQSAQFLGTFARTGSATLVTPQ